MGTESSKIPSTFVNTCHSGLKTAKQQDDKLYIQIDKNTFSTAWCNTVTPLLKQKSYLFLPISIQEFNNNSSLFACTSDSININQFRVEYDCYIYNLRQQLIARKQTGHFFMEWQAWKILRKCTKALYEWRISFPNKIIGKISPRNIVMTNKGKIKLVNKLSFANDPQKQHNELNEQIYTRDFQTYVKLDNQLLGQSQKDLAITMIQIMTMQQFPQSQLSIIFKISLLKQSSLYSKLLKNLIFALLQNPANQKPTLKQLLQISKQQQQRLKKLYEQKLIN